jgi:hypothetical protein
LSDGKPQRRQKPKLNGYAGDVLIAKSIIDMTAAMAAEVMPNMRTSRFMWIAWLTMHITGGGPGTSDMKPGWNPAVQCMCRVRVHDSEFELLPELGFVPDPDAFWLPRVGVEINRAGRLSTDSMVDIEIKCSPSGVGEPAGLCSTVSEDKKVPCILMNRRSYSDASLDKVLR